MTKQVGGQEPQKTELKRGDRIFNHGDIANEQHFGTVIEVKADQFRTSYRIESDATEDEPARHYWIPATAVDPVYKGHAGTRIVPMAAFNNYRAEQCKRLRITFQPYLTRVMLDIAEEMR